MKKVFLLFSILFVSLFNLVAEEKYSIKIRNADRMETSDSVVILTGNVDLVFSSSEDNENVERELICRKVSINLDDKILQAEGNVSLTQNNESSFHGDELVLNWETLDVVVFGGRSSTVRNNSSGTDVEFVSSGDRISYSGNVNTVYFEKGTVATREKNPNWSISADEIGLFDSDMFFRNAWLKLGRVKILWLPFFFYPGTTLSFNPSVGFSSSRGAFLNTTYEVYGKYRGSKNSNSSTDSTAKAVLSFLKTENGSNGIRDGWIYSDIDYSELSDFQKWAVDTSSYFAVFADMYQLKGISVGFDTDNSLLGGKIKLGGTGIVAKPQVDSSSSNLRYFIDISAKYSEGNTVAELSVPVLSDPYVKSDYLNRNTVFSFDSVFGTYQDFPSSFGSVSDYSWTFDFSTDFRFGNSVLKVKNLDADVEFNYSSSDKKFSIKKAELPSVSVSLSGTLFDYKTDSKTVTVTEAETRDTEVACVGSVKAFPVPLSAAVTKTVNGFSISSDYSLNATYKDVYSSLLKRDSGLLTADGKINLKSSLPDSWLTLSESISASYLKNVREEYSVFSDDGYVLSNLTVSSEKIGLTYKLENKLFVYSNSVDSCISRRGKFDTSDVQAHSIELSKKVGSFTFSVSKNLKPLTGTVKPSVNFSDNGYFAKTSVEFDPSEDKFMEKSKTCLDFGYSKSKFSLEFDNKYDSSKNGWDGYSMSQNLSYSFFEGKASVAEKMDIVEQFKVDSIQLFANYNGNSVTFNLSGPNIEPENLKLVLSYDHEPRYVWKNRIGFDCSADGTFVWDFKNRYSSSLSFDFSMNFGVSELLDISFGMKVANTSFYKYFDSEGNYKKGSILKDLMNSFDFVGDGRYHTGFNISSMSLNAVHYMEDWNLYFSASAGIDKVNEKYTLVPEASFIIKWNVIPELKVKNELELK